MNSVCSNDALNSSANIKTPLPFACFSRVFLEERTAPLVWQRIDECFKEPFSSLFAIIMETLS